MSFSSRRLKEIPARLGYIFLPKARDTQKDAESICAPVPAGVISCTGASKAGQKLLGREAEELVKCFSQQSSSPREARKQAPIITACSQ